jgi:sugar phosphate isomerase/epimerase
VQFSGLSEEEGKMVDEGYLREMARFAADNGLYLEWGGGRHVPMDMSTWQKKDIFESNRKAAAQASLLGTRVVRSCSGGLMRWDPGSPSTEALLSVTAGVLREQRSMLRDHGVVLALETHFEFTTFELLRIFEMCETEPGDYLGVCLDSMNLLTMLEDPLAGTRRVLPWVVATHIKDGGILLRDEGVVTFPCEIGQGVVDLEEIIALLRSLPQEVNLSIEDHGGEFRLPIFDGRFLSEFPDLTLQEFVGLCRLSRLTEARMRGGALEMTSREEWPGVCEGRIEQDLAALKILASP